MQSDLDALRLLISKEHSFPSQRRYLQPGHDTLVPLLIRFSAYFKEKQIPQNVSRDLRLQIVSNIVERQVSSFYSMTIWEIQTISKYLEDLEEQSSGSATRFLDYVTTQS